MLIKAGLPMKVRLLVVLVGEGAMKRKYADDDGDDDGDDSGGGGSKPTKLAF